jgi:hypothetical protein
VAVAASCVLGVIAGIVLVNMDPALVRTFLDEMLKVDPAEVVEPGSDHFPPQFPPPHAPPTFPPIPDHSPF